MKERTNDQWIAELNGPGCDKALKDLREVLERGLKAALAGRIVGDFDATVEDLVQEGLIKVLHNMGSFRGESRFTTWAQKITIHAAFTELRRQRWRDVSLQERLEQRGEANAGPEMLENSPSTPEQQTARQATLSTAERLIEEELTDRQRRVMLSVIDGMPLEEVARRMGTNRNAVYKTLHDARKRLKRRMTEEGLSPQEALATFTE